MDSSQRVLLPSTVPGSLLSFGTLTGHEFRTWMDDMNV